MSTEEVANSNYDNVAPFGLMQMVKRGVRLANRNGIRPLACGSLAERWRLANRRQAGGWRVAGEWLAGGWLAAGGSRALFCMSAVHYGDEKQVMETMLNMRMLKMRMEMGNTTRTVARIKIGKARNQLMRTIRNMTKMSVMNIFLV